MIKNIIGKKFTHLLVIEFDNYDKKSKKSFWKCLCDCGNIKICRGDVLKSGKNKTCGCYLRKEAHQKRMITHNKSNSSEYNSWCGMKNRCNSPTCFEYHNYGGRGITVCKEWNTSFETFYADMGNKPEGKYSLERIDVNGNYCKENCKWATDKEQNNNLRDNVRITYNNETNTLAQWSVILNMNYKTLQNRYNRGWDLERIFTEAVNHKNESSNKEKNK